MEICIIILLCWLAEEGAGTSVPEVPPLPRRELERRVDDLGHEDWRRRREAERILLGEGGAVLEKLREAQRSANPEKARRARFIISQLDPPAAWFAILRFELGPDPRLAALSTAEGPAGKEIAATARQGAGEAPPYGITWRPAGGDGVRAAVRRRDVSSRAEVESPFETSPSLWRLELEEESRYTRRSGILGDVERRRFLVAVLQQRVPPPGKDLSAPVESDAILRWLEEILLEQAAGPGEPEETAALEILELLRRERAADAFLRALEVEETALSGALGLAAIEHPEAAARLRRAFVAQRDAASTATPDRMSRMLRAAGRLASSGDEDAVDLLLEEIVKRAVPHHQELLSALTDALPSLARFPALCRRIRETALREDILAQASWAHPETELFLTRLLQGLDAEDGEDHRLAARAAAVLERLAAGSDLPPRPSLSTLAALWKIAARKASPSLPPPDEFPLLEAFLSRPGNTSALREAISWITTRLPGSEIPAPCFENLLARIEESISSSEPALRASHVQQWLQLSASIRLGSGQLSRWVRLLESCAREYRASPPAAGSPAASRSSLIQQIERELDRWTGLSAAGRGAVSGRTGAESPWARWLSDAGAVARREEAIRAEREALIASGGEILYYEFDVLLPARPAPPAGERAAAGLRILEGFRIRVRAGETALVEDSRGQRHRLLIERLGRGDPTVHLLNGTLRLVTGVPVAGSQPVPRLQEIVYRTSDRDPLGRPFHRPASSRLRTIRMVVDVSSEPELPVDGRLAPTELWERLRTHHLLRPPEGISPSEMIQRAHLLGDLADPAASAVLRGFLAKQPPFAAGQQIARRLEDIEGAPAVDYFIGVLERGAEGDALAAALALCQRGRPEGARRLLDTARETPPATLRASRDGTILRGLEQYFQAAGPGAEEASRAVRFLADRIVDTRLQASVLRVVAHLAGTDFGYAEIARRPVAERVAARDACVAKAKLWLEERASGSGAAAGNAGTR
ncbi:MAG: hypothetical protein JXA90_00645 [Planctomycetes bacterium]|nr:hypothetical protein [Planctomycetota bacterium]